MKYLILLAGCLLAFNSFSATETRDKAWSPTGTCVQDTDMSSAQALQSVPSGAKAVWLSISGDDIRLKDDGNSPTASVGIELKTDKSYFYTGDLSAVEVIEESTSSILDMCYYE